MTTFTTYATATFASGNIVVVQSAENMIPGLPIVFSGTTFGNVTAGATYYIGNITFGFPTSNITLTSLPGGATYALADGSGNMTASFSQGGQQIIPTVPPGEPLNVAFDAINVNFDQIWAAGPVGTNIQIDENTIYTLDTNGNLVLNPNGIGNVIANAHVIPDQDRVRNLGSPLLRWNTVYAQNIVGNISGNVDAGGSNTQVQFNDNGTLAGANGFTFQANTSSVSVVGSITAGNVLTPGIVSSTGGIYGDIYTTMIDSGDSSAILVVADTEFMSDVTIDQNLYVNNQISATGNVTGGNILFGSGIVSGTGNIYANKIFANIQGNVDAAGNLYEVQFNTTGDQLGASANFTYNSANNVLTVSAGNIVAGNASVTGNVTANYYFGNGSQLTGIITSVSNVVNGNSNINIASPGSNITVAVGGVSNTVVFTTDGVNVSGNVSASYYFGNGSQLTGITADNVNANALTGNTLSANVLFSSLTSVGVLSDLSVSGNITVGNIFIPSSGNVNLGNVNINNLAEPAANSDAATKFYVDSVAGNLLPIITNQTINPNGSANTFVLNQTTTAVGILLTINGVTQTPGVNYTVTGNSLTMAETPLSSDIIQVRFLSGTTSSSIAWVTPPVANTSVGTPGQAAYDAGGNLYVCVSANSWAKFAGTISW